MFKLVILNTYILNKHYGCEKLTHNEYSDKIVRYLLAEGLKNYNIPLPPVISRRIGKYHEDFLFISDVIIKRSFYNVM